jgi:hypothetical protein
MGMKAYKQAVAVTGSYTDRQGNEKKRYTNVGTLFQYNDGGFALKLDSVPVCDGWNGFISFFDIKPRDGAQATDNQVSKSRESFSADLDDEIPF